MSIRHLFCDLGSVIPSFAPSEFRSICRSKFNVFEGLESAVKESVRQFCKPPTEFIGSRSNGSIIFVRDPPGIASKSLDIFSSVDFTTRLRSIDMDEVRLTLVHFDFCSLFIASHPSSPLFRLFVFAHLAD